MAHPMQYKKGGKVKKGGWAKVHKGEVVVPKGKAAKMLGGKGKRKLKLNPPSKGHKPKGAHGRAAVRALGRTKTTGNFKKIEKAKGKGAAIAAYQNALKAHKG